MSETSDNLYQGLKMKNPGRRILCESHREQKGHKESWLDKPLHFMYHQQIKELADIKKSLKWIGKAVLIEAMQAVILVHKCAEPKNIIRDLC